MMPDYKVDTSNRRLHVQLPANSDGKSILVTGPAEVVAPNMTWKIPDGVAVYLDVENEDKDRPWGWRMTLAYRDTRPFWPKDNLLWSVCGNCDAPARGHIKEPHCGSPPNYVMGENPHEARRAVCPGGPSCRCAPIKAWFMVSGHVRVLNETRDARLITIKDRDRLCRMVLGPGEISEAIADLSYDAELTSSADITDMQGKATIIPGQPDGGGA